MLNKKIFGEHLTTALAAVNVDAKSGRYKIYPILEDGKKYTSKDDFVRLNVFPPDKISQNVYTFDDIVQRFSVFEPYYPLWVHIYIKGDIIELHTSLRFRKPSVVLHQNTGTEPFTVINEQANTKEQ